MDITVFNDIEELKKYFGFTKSGTILETDIFKEENETDVNSRQVRDAEVLTTIAKNMDGNCLEIGTSSGRGTFKLATNTNGIVYTVNALPEQISGNFVTHAMKKEQIGSYLLQKGIRNYVQIYENSMSWKLPSEFLNSMNVVFIDGCHDTEFVYRDSYNTWDSLKNGGFMIWHDFNPDLRGRFDWINSAMKGVEGFQKMFRKDLPDGALQVFHLKHSFMGFMRMAGGWRNIE